jgi:hypothetical protein
VRVENATLEPFAERAFGSSFALHAVWCGNTETEHHHGVGQRKVLCVECRRRVRDTATKTNPVNDTNGFGDDASEAFEECALGGSRALHAVRCIDVETQHHAGVGQHKELCAERRRRVRNTAADIKAVDDAAVDR